MFLPLAADILRRQLGSLLTNPIKVSEEGRAARTEIPCPECGKPAIASACSNVGGFWVRCPHCNHFDEN